MKSLHVVALMVTLLTTAWLSTANAQPMAERVPGNSLLYVGWDGVEKHQQAYNQSHLKAVLEASNFGALFDQVANAAAQQGGNADAAQGKQLVQVALNRPWAMFLAVPDGSTNPQDLNFGFIVDAGDQAQAFEQMLQNAKANAEAQAGMNRAQGNSNITRNGNIVTMISGSGKLMQLPEGGQNAFAGTNRISKELVGSVKTPVGYMWADVEKLSSMLRDAAVANTPENAQKQTLQQVWKSLGLEGLKSGTWVAGFEGQNWVNSAQLSAPNRTGLLSLFDQPIDPAVLNVVPSTATSVQAVNFDMAKMVEQLRKAAANQPQNGVDQALQMASATLNVDVENELFAGLGDQWVAYTDPSFDNAAGGFPAGMVIINKLRKPDQFQQTIDKLNAAIQQQLQQRAQNAQQGGMAPQMQLSSNDINGVKVTSLSMGAASPSWAVADGRYYFGFYPRVVAAAVKAAGGQQSITSQTAFKQAYGQVTNNQGKPVSMQYVDLKRTAPQQHQQFSSILGLAQSMALNQQPVQVLPPVDVLMQHLGPAVGVATANDQGWQYRSVTPFPGASLFGPSPMPADPQMMIQMLPMLQGMAGGGMQPGMQPGNQQQPQQRGMQQRRQGAQQQGAQQRQQQPAGR